MCLTTQRNLRHPGLSTGLSTGLSLVLLGLLLCWSPPGYAEESSHDALVVIFDGSGSMDEIMSGSRDRRIDVAKRALKQVLKEVPDSTHVGILAFGRHGGWIYPIGPVRIKEMNAAIDQVQPGGQTPLGEFIAKGANALLDERKQQYNYGRYRLLVLTDGDASDEALMLQVAPTVVRRQIRMDVIGVDMTGGQKHRLASLASSYQRGDDPKSFREALRKVVVVERTGDGKAGEDDFALLAGLPDDVAALWLEGVTAAASNTPIR